MFEKSTGQTPLNLRCRYCWITLVYFAKNFFEENLLFTTNIECFLTISSFLGCICRHPRLHRAYTPHVWLYTVNFKLFEISKTKTEHGILSSVYFFPFGFHLGPFGFHLGPFGFLLGPFGFLLGTFGFLLGPFGFFWVLLGESTHPFQKEKK